MIDYVYLSTQLLLKVFQAIILLFISAIVSAQSADTLYTSGKVIIRSNTISIFDSIEWKTKQMAVHLSGNSQSQRTLSVSQQQNSCGVSSDFTPGGDTTFATPFTVTFTSKSANATSLQWIVGGFAIGNQLTLTYSFSQVGLHDVKLVAKNGSCSDTSVAYYLLTGLPSVVPLKTLVNNYGLPDTDEYATQIEHLHGGGFLLGGYSNGGPSYLSDRGILIKLKESGCVEWTKLFQGEYAGRIGAVKALKDSGFIVSALSYLNCTLMRFDKAGQLIWKHNYAYGSNKISFTQIYEAVDGSFFIAAQEAGFQGLYVAKLTGSGTFVWCKYYLKANLDMAGPQGIAEVGSRIFISGYISNPNQEATYNSEYNRDGFIVSIDQANGTTVWAKSYIS